MVLSYGLFSYGFLVMFFSYVFLVMVISYGFCYGFQLWSLVTVSSYGF